MSESEKSELLKKMDSTLDGIRPHLAVDGGNIELIDVTEDYKVLVKWIGNCVNCSMSAMTMKAGIEQALKSKHPEVQSVEAVNGIGL